MFLSVWLSSCRCNAPFAPRRLEDVGGDARCRQWLARTPRQRHGVDFNLAYIPESFKAIHKEEFDTEYMRALYQVGYTLAVKGYPWLKKPP
jgi:hypothetical protein